MIYGMVSNDELKGILVGIVSYRHVSFEELKMFLLSASYSRSRDLIRKLFPITLIHPIVTVYLGGSQI